MKQEMDDQEATFLGWLEISANCLGNDSRHCDQSSSASHPFLCFDSITSIYISTAFLWANLTIQLPLAVFILHLGVRRWRRQRSVSSAAALSLSDFITYNLAVMELIGVLGNTIIIYSRYVTEGAVMTWVGFLIGIFPWYGQMLFPVLSCVEHYMAVVHPITYLTLRQGRSVHIRNNTTVCIWLQSFAGMVMMVITIDHIEISLILCACEMAMLVIAVSFCSLSILCVLTRPRPGEAGVDRVDQSKRRALHTVMIITAVLLLRFGGNLVCHVMSLSATVSHDTQCVMNALIGWFNLPSSLSLPLLFLHRAGKLPGSKPKPESG